MPTVKMMELYTATGKLLDTASRTAAWLAGNDDLTPQGRLSKLKGYAETCAWTETAESVRAAVDAVRAAAEEWGEAAMAEYMPTAETDAARVAAELEAARLLARGGDGGALAQELMALPVSPGRTIALEELVARGAVARDTLAAQWPGVREVRTTRRHVETAMAEIEDGLEAFEELMAGGLPQNVVYRSLMLTYLERGVVPEVVDVEPVVRLASPRVPAGLAGLSSLEPVMQHTADVLERHGGGQPELDAKVHGAVRVTRDGTVRVTR